MCSRFHFDCSLTPVSAQGEAAAGRETAARGARPREDDEPDGGDREGAAKEDAGATTGAAAAAAA